VASYDRIVERAKKIFDKAKVTINFDHHKTNNGFAKYNLIDPKASSASEILFTFFEENGIEITKDMADCLYVGILTDTGSFRYETTSPKTFEIAKKLVEIGVNPAEIAKKCYDTKPKKMVLFQAYCLNNAVFLNDDKIAYTVILHTDMKKFETSDEHTEGIAVSLRSIKTVEISFVIKEAAKNCFKVSLRSKYQDVAKVAQAFSGGGHTFAAGCTVKMPKDEVIKALLSEIEKVL
jgi:phosphoesterase RecJ-like protein